MNKERMLGVMNNLLLEMQDGRLLNNKGINKVMRVLVDEMKPNKKCEE